MLNFKKYPLALLQRIKVEEESSTNEGNSLSDRKEVGIKHQNLILERESTSQNTSIGDSVVKNEILPLRKSVPERILDFDNVVLKGRKDSITTNLLVKIKKEESDENVTHELVRFISEDSKTELLNQESLPVVKLESNLENDQDSNNFNDDRNTSPDLSVVSTFRDDSSCIKLIDCSVRLKDLFSNNVRRLGKAHLNSRSCLCVYCRGEYKHTVSKSGRRPNIGRQKDEDGIEKFSEYKKLNSMVRFKVRNIQKFDDFSVGLKKHQSLQSGGKEHAFHSESSVTVPVSQTVEEIFECRYCPKICKRKNGLFLHMRKHGDMSFECKLCSATFRQNFYLETHFIRSHTSEKPFKCTQCAAAFKFPEGLRQHSRVHSVERPFACTLCPGRFKSRGGLNQHAVVHREERLFECRQCEKTFKDKQKLLHHMGVHSKPFKCEQCPARFAANPLLKNHVISCHTSERRYKCEQCPAKFKFLSILKRHIYLHHIGERPYKCKLCPATFKQPYFLTQHLRTFHNDEKPYPCHLCSVRFKTKQGMKTHLLGHSSEKPFECEICMKKFVDKPRLLQHLTYHGKKSFECKQCNAKFSTKSGLKLHLQIHSSERPYKCAECFASFKFKDNLKSHLYRRHNEEKLFSCQLCSAKFKTPHDMRSHLMVHTDKRSFKCKQCPAAFKQSSTLKKHCLKVHCKEGEFSCAHCSAKFRKKGRLIVHCNKWHSKGSNTTGKGSEGN